MFWLILVVNIIVFDKRLDFDVWGKECYDFVIL